MINDPISYYLDNAQQVIMIQKYGLFTSVWVEFVAGFESMEYTAPPGIIKEFAKLLSEIEKFNDPNKVATNRGEIIVKIGKMRDLSQVMEKNNYVPTFQSSAKYLQ